MFDEQRTGRNGISEICNSGAVERLAARRRFVTRHARVHHKKLLRHAYALHQNQMIYSGDRSDLLELADSALAFAVESLLDIDSDE